MWKYQLSIHHWVAQKRISEDSKSESSCQLKRLKYGEENNTFNMTEIGDSDKVRFQRKKK